MIRRSDGTNLPHAIEISMMETIQNSNGEPRENSKHFKTRWNDKITMNETNIYGFTNMNDESQKIKIDSMHENV